MFWALERHCGEVVPLGPVPPDITLYLGKVRNQLSLRLLGKKYDYAFSTLIARHYAQRFAAKLARERFDWVFAPAASTEIAFLDTPLPLVYLSDATVSLLRGYYPDFSNLTNEKEAEEIERRATRRAGLLVYPSQWAAASARRDYGVDSDRLVVVPFGANLEPAPAHEEALGRQPGDRCQLLFLGVDWQRKGGEITFETLLALDRLGIPAQLTICGCVPPARFDHPHLKVIPFLGKNNPAQSRQLLTLLLASNFLLLPTRADCTPIVLCEAAAAGLPVLVADTGGVAGAVQDGENGFILPYEARGEAYARQIAWIYGEPERYIALVRSSRASFEARLNWDSWAMTIGSLVQERWAIPAGATI